MLVETDEWRLGSLTEGSDREYAITHIPSGFRVSFNRVHVQRDSPYRVTFHLCDDWSVSGVFRDSEKLPDDITEKLMELNKAE